MYHSRSSGLSALGEQGVQVKNDSGIPISKHLENRSEHWESRQEVENVIQSADTNEKIEALRATPQEPASVVHNQRRRHKKNMTMHPQKRKRRDQDERQRVTPESDTTPPHTQENTRATEANRRPKTRYPTKLLNQGRRGVPVRNAVRSGAGGEPRESIPRKP